MEYKARCSCGDIEIIINLPEPIESYSARKCDCDFCVPRCLAYLSDANGTLSFTPKDKLVQLKQGSGQATFWQCRNCEDVVAVSNTQNGDTRGAAVKGLFEGLYSLQESVTVSPKTLSAAEKLERWPLVWAKVV